MDLHFSLMVKPRSSITKPDFVAIPSTPPLTLDDAIAFFGIELVPRSTRARSELILRAKYNVAELQVAGMGSIFIRRTSVNRVMHVEFAGSHGTAIAADVVSFTAALRAIPSLPPAFSRLIGRVNVDTGVVWPPLHSLGLVQR